MNRRRMFLRLLLVGLIAWLGTFHLRYSVETLKSRQTLLYIPFTVSPFTNRIESVTSRFRSELQPGQQLIAINGRPFTGMSVYAQELRAAHSATERGFSVTVWSKDDTINEVSPGWAHCTCGVPSIWHILRYWVLPPLFCVTLGIAVVWLRPLSSIAWVFLALMLSLSQTTFIPEPTDAFQQSVDVRQWSDPFLRISAVVHQSFWSASWPAWLCLFAAHWFRVRGVNWIKLLTSVPFVLGAVLKVIFDVALSENYRPFVGAYELLQSFQTELLLVGVVAAVSLAFGIGRGAGVLAAVAAVVSIAMIYWPVTPPLGVEGIEYAGKPTNTHSVLPSFYRTPELVKAVFALLAFLGVSIANWRSQTVMFASAVAALACSMAHPLIAWSGNWTVRLWYSALYMDVSLLLAAFGVSGIACRF